MIHYFFIFKIGNLMKEFDELVGVVDHLLGENGCPWDRKQTMKTIRADFLEEVCELIEAIDLEDNSHIEEELGDVFFNVVFLSRLAEKESRTKMIHALAQIKDKLVRRHPHVFGNDVINTEDELLEAWEKIKLKEKGKENRKSILDGIPKGLPALARASKVLKKMQKAHFPDLPTLDPLLNFENEEALGEFLVKVVMSSLKNDQDPENALKNYLYKLESIF
jgi:tetrapyrrole methylase family protein/MazG family protein